MTATGKQARGNRRGGMRTRTRRRVYELEKIKQNNDGIVRCVECGEVVEFDGTGDWGSIATIDHIISVQDCKRLNLPQNLQAIVMESPNNHTIVHLSCNGKKGANSSVEDITQTAMTILERDIGRISLLRLMEQNEKTKEDRHMKVSELISALADVNPELEVFVGDEGDLGLLVNAHVAISDEGGEFLALESEPEEYDDNDDDDIHSA